MSVARKVREPLARTHRAEKETDLELVYFVAGWAPRTAGEWRLGREAMRA